MYGSTVRTPPTTQVFDIEAPWPLFTGVSQVRCLGAVLRVHTELNISEEPQNTIPTWYIVL